MAKDDVIARPVATSFARKQAQPSSATAGRGRTYDADVYGWAIDQAGHIRAGRYDLLDVANVAEEIEALGRHEFDVLVSNLAVVLQHMLKWDHQSERRARSWALSIAEHRTRVSFTLKDNPSLAPRREDALVRAYELACTRAAIETSLSVKTFPATNPYTWAEVVERPFVHGFE